MLERAGAAHRLQDMAAEFAVGLDGGAKAAEGGGGGMQEEYSQTADGKGAAGAQFTCFTSTKVQILTL